VRYFLICPTLYKSFPVLPHGSQLFGTSANSPALSWPEYRRHFIEPLNWESENAVLAVCLVGPKVRRQLGQSADNATLRIGK
jgi:hypothetical protein